ncbi:SDR family NAD(P)-dependent oxidoreductase [Saccharicrinis sp. FJH54]|uniref:SDR family NAD(P)-dependent oxidoreductase n=1 Tax=Saccharicrinis sp. FJH54 TaxID=3344665 RepID=UPI0035D4A39E
MEQHVKDLIEISQFYGKNSEMVIAGGGNTSVKTDDKIWVKASGSALSTITEEGFAVLDRAKLKLIAQNSYSSDPFEREQQIKDDLYAATITKERRPSVETSLHDLMNYSFVIHLHPTYLNGLLCSQNAEQVINELFGDSAIYIPYTDPGYILFKEVESQVEKYVKEKGVDPKVIFLQNHGVFVAADTTDEVKSIYDDIFSKVKAQIKEALPEEVLPVKEGVSEFIPALRMLVSDDKVKTLKVRRNKLTEHFASNAENFDKISKPFTPDIIVYCKSNYIYLENTESAAALIAEFQQKYEVFQKEQTHEPKVVVIKDYGIAAIAETAAQTNIILDVFEDMLKIGWISESFGGPHAMTAEQIQFIDTWEVENYRRKVAAGSAKTGRVENKTIIVTGAAQGFGEGIARELILEGANIVVADINPEVGQKTAAAFNEIASKNRAIFVQTDVSNMDSLNNLMDTTVAEFGGLDAFISNAGILHAGGLDEMDPATFDLVTKINYNAYFYCTKVASAVMKLQNAYKPGYYTDIIQINSKSGLKGSKKNFAYAGGKFGGIGLTQSFALELAPDKIKVNSVCPGNFYEGPLWSDPENGLFVQYLNAGKVPGAKTIDDVKAFYLAQVPLGKGCSPKDVVKAVLYAIDQENETGQAIPVSGGQEMLR